MFQLSTSEMANVRPLYRFGKTEMFDLAKRSFWHSILTAFNKEPRRVLDIIEDIIGNRSSISEAEEVSLFLFYFNFFISKFRNGKTHKSI